MDLFDSTYKVRQKALELGFDACGFSKAGPLDEEAFRLEQWLNQNLNSSMGWMANHFDKRIDPTKLVPGAKSVVSVIMSYRYHENEIHDLNTEYPKIAKYARGRDYHKVFKGRLKQLFNFTKEIIGNVEGRIFVDSAPVMDKAWAQRSGLGWLGKNGNLLNKKSGSWFLIGEMIIDVPFHYDAPVTDHCGSCTACIDACPTHAIHEPYRIDSSRCISYLTIELKEKIPAHLQEQTSGWMFGCDICQDVCPWNRDAALGHIEDLKPRNHVLSPPVKKWSDLREDQFETIFNGSAVRRAGYEKFIDNAKIAENSSKTD
tara:strand:+ start:23323 stop:24270 length:948 start_codon:yes stop_codon:yes gene_type:complete